MNSEKFDRVVLDLLYGELDELTAAAAKRHMDQSARAREIFAHFKATRQLSVLPVHAPPANFEAALMERERRTIAELPLHHRIGRLVSMLAGYAMRPQLVMGALLLLMIGSSLVLVRARPGQHSAVQVTEGGAPELEAEPSSVTQAGAGAARGRGVAEELQVSAASGAEVAGPASAATGSLRPARTPGAQEGLDPFERALASYREGRHLEAQRAFEQISRSGSHRAPEAALYAARAVQSASGCVPAISRFERVRLEFPDSASASEATWRAAKCLQETGDLDAARQSYESLLTATSYAQRARAALAGLARPTPSTAPLPRASR